MENNSSDNSVNRSFMLGSIIRAVVLIIVSILIAVTSVSFAVHHMRLKFEDEFINQSTIKINNVSDNLKLILNGDDLTNDPAAASDKYDKVFKLMLSDTSTEKFSRESYGLFIYADGQLSVLIKEGEEDPKQFAVASKDISEWLKGDYSPTSVEGDGYRSMIIPITNNTGRCVAVFEYKVDFDGLYKMGETLEGRIFLSVIISLAAGIVLFAVQEIVIKMMRKRQVDSNGQSETKKGRERRLIASTIGYCFTIILVVLFVMSANLTGQYIKVLETERGDSIKRSAVMSAVSLSHYQIEEDFDYPILINEYADDKAYIANIYTNEGDSFKRIFTSLKEKPSEPYYLANVGNQYMNSFQQQNVALTKRSENKTDYVCAVAPIISKENTVFGVLELMEPQADFETTVNGMSLSWVFTIISIAISMAIIIFELNMLISTVTKGIKPNMPVLIMYGENANRFLSFFTAFGSVMIPIVFSGYIKHSFADSDQWVIQLLIAVGLALYSIGFFGFSRLRYFIKYKITSRLALVAVTSVGYIFAILCGILDNAVLLLVLSFPIGFCFGMPFDYLRDYRINAGNTRYKDYDDRTVHNIQATQSFLGISVGTVVAGMVFERFGLLIVVVISGASLILTTLGMLSFMQGNSIVKESHLSINKFAQLFTDKYTGRLLNSGFLTLGFVISFMLFFIPNFLQKVGISIATAAFYYLISAFIACFVCVVIKSRFSDILTSKVRIIIQATAIFVGLLLFALFPTAKILVVTVTLFGVALGIHDFYYLYVLYLLSNNRFKANLRRVAEHTVIIGLVIAIPVFMIAFIIGQLRYVFLASVVLVTIIAFLYPLSQFANDVDDRNPGRKKAPANKDQETGGDING